MRRPPLVPAPIQPGSVGLFQQVALDSRIDANKFEKLIGLYWMQQERDAKAAFEAAFARMQPELPRIKKNGKIVVPSREGKQGYSHPYATYEAIRAIVDPILLRHGFQISHKTVRQGAALDVVTMLTHERGHTRETLFPLTADPTGGKNVVQGFGSGESYGKRYGLKAVLALIEEGKDDDGQGWNKGQAAARVHEAEIVQPRAARADDGQQITEPQRKRLFAIVKGASRTEEELRQFLLRRYGLTSTREITRGLYDEICAALQASGVLPSRAPGED